jgi:exopolyphosphatase/guanosine-5'-triphosphate,3'-diphosphate pyrophosphatase
MNLSIIDIGTQSLKHYIFTVINGEKTIVHYKRYSDAHLGGGDTLDAASIERTLAILNECLSLNASKHVIALQILGTEALRKATNAAAFTDKVKEMSGKDVEVISQDLEAQYLYEGFVSLVPENYHFAAMNIGGGSTELVVGDNHALVDSVKFPFGVKFLRNSFSKEDGSLDWKGIDAYLEREILVDSSATHAFVTGVLDFITVVGPSLGFTFEESSIPHHPVQMSMDTYVSYLEILRNTPVDELKKLYPKDPGYGDNFAIGQSVYVTICRKLNAEVIIPSNNDLTDGVIHRLISA